MKTSLNRWLAILLISLAVLAGYAYFASQAFVKIEVNTASPTNFRLYWKTGAQSEYSDADSTLIQVYPDKRFYTAALADLRDITHLRVDPTNGRSLFQLTELSVYQAGFEPVRFMRGSLKDLHPMQGVGAKKYGESGLIYQPSSWDSWFEADFKLIAESDSNWTHIWRLVLLLVAVLLMARAYPAFTKEWQFVPSALLLVFALVSTMSIISRPHAHPDEHAHLQAALYYENNNSIPAACDTDTRHTYTIYGTSRLNTNELTYFIAGKFLQLTDVLPVDYFLKLRFFNVLLFGLLVLLAFKRPAARIILLPLLVSPQFWYVFSYFNSDALAIFMALIIAYQVTTAESLFRRFLNQSGRHRYLTFTLLATLACFLFFTKKNFYFFALFLAGAALVFAWTNRTQLKPAVLPILGLLLLSGSTFSAWTYYQQSIHGFERSARILECRNQTAKLEYKPSTPLKQAHNGLSLNLQNIPLTDLLKEKYSWPQRVFMSAFGNFGYVSLPASWSYYQLIIALLSAATAYILWVTIRLGNASQRWLVAGYTSLLTLLVAIALYKSWTVDFQPQGRFLFPIIPITAALLGWLRPILNPRVLSLFALMLFLLGLFSFTSIGLTEISKVGF